MKIGVPTVEFEVTESPDPIRRVWQYATTSGGSYSSTTPEINATTYTANFPATGVYYIVCNSEYESKNIFSNEVELEVVNIELSPSSNQTINMNTDGTTISVTETGSVDSREWMYTTTSGDGYTSFDQSETGTSYTPNFASAGTYYVVCATVFSGVTIYSDEISVTVSGNPGINNTELNNLAVYPNPTTGKFRIQEELNGKYRVDAYNSQGKLVLSEEYNGLDGAQEFSLNDKGIYVINLVTPDYIKTTKLIVE
jgi:plastocyanin